MKTLIFENFPDLFWKMVLENQWDQYFFDIARQDIRTDAEIALIRTNTLLDNRTIDSMPNLRMIIRAGSGYDNIAISYARGKGICVCTTPEANAIAAFEHTITLIMALLKSIYPSREAVITGTWKKTLNPNWEITDLRALIVGMGRIGTRVARFLISNGAAVKGVDPFLSRSEWQKRNIENTDYEKGLQWCNLISYHCPLTSATVDYFSSSALMVLANPVWLINTARGRIVNWQALKSGLDDGRILGAALDVYPQEPYTAEKFLRRDNVLLSPHSAAMTERAKKRMVEETLRVWADFVFKKQTLCEVNYNFYLDL